MSHHIALLFDSEWLCHYPRPAKVVYNNATEFACQKFQELLENYEIKAVLILMIKKKAILEISMLLRLVSIHLNILNSF